MTSPSRGASFRGRRFPLDLAADDDDDPPAAPPPPPAPAFVGDVVEREPASAPAAPHGPAAGFPQHKKRVFRASAFKQQRAAAAAAAAPRPSPPSHDDGGSSSSSHDADPDDAERRAIDRENRRRLAAMSDDEILLERQGLLANLDPALVRRLLTRASLDDGRGDTGVDARPAAADASPAASEAPRQPPRAAASADAPAASRTVRFDVDDDAEPASPGRLQPVTRFSRAPVHFPTPPPAPDLDLDLDPSDPSFLAALHAKCFPTLPVDPARLAWMAPVAAPGSAADAASPYSPAQASLPPSALRFDFRGALLPPRVARAPRLLDRGLHHHADAPEAAGYSVPELARLARSAFPAQRCVAFQTLGRLLFRLGRGDWGRDDLAAGLWRCLADGRVLDALHAAAAADAGHQGAKAYAVEALWLWQKGGGHTPPAS